MTCGAHLEPLLEEELRELGFKETRLGFRGVYVEIEDFSSVYKINYMSRLASRVLTPIEHFKVWDDRTLYRDARKIDWSAYLSPKVTFAIDFSVDHPAFRNSLYAAQVLKDAICDQFREKEGVRPSVDTAKPDVQLNLFIREGWATISLDTSGAPLHKRGYRTEGGEAPMQESLAAALLRLAHYTRDEILLDPCMGSGTILIEAALIASNTPPGYLRQKWGFFFHPRFDEKEWLRVKAEFDAKIISPIEGRLFGIDINKAQTRLTQANLRSAGTHRWVKATEGDFRTHSPAVKPSLIIGNPPFGKRLGEDAYLGPLYDALGDFLKKQAPARAFILTTPDHSVGLRPAKRHVLATGGLDARLLEFELY